MAYGPLCKPSYYRIDNGLYLVVFDNEMVVARASEIQLLHPDAIMPFYKTEALPFNTRLRVARNADGVSYVLFRGHEAIFRANYIYSTDELTNVRTAKRFRNKGYATSLIRLILQVDGPTNITVVPSIDSPVGMDKLLRLYSSFAGYHAVPGTNKVIRLMSAANLLVKPTDNNDRDYAKNLDQVEEAALAQRDVEKISETELEILLQNTKELNRLKSLLYPINQATVDNLLKSQKTDIISLQNAVEIYTQDWFNRQTWGSAHRVMFAQGMADLLFKFTKRRNGIWDDIIAVESV